MWRKVVCESKGQRSRCLRLTIANFSDSRGCRLPIKLSESCLPVNDEARMQALDKQVAHVWMVRTFLKHSDEAAEDEELASVHRDLYDFMLALGPSLDAGDSKA